MMAGDTPTSSPPHERWLALSRAAVLGTDRAAPPPPEASPWAASVNCSTEDPALQMLDEIAALSVYQRAGYRVEKTEAAVEPCADAGRACPPQAAAHLHDILHGRHKPLLIEWCRAAFVAGVHAPSEAVPDLLSRATNSRDPAARQLLLDVAGRRGAWLAALHPTWRAPALAADTNGDPVAIFETGSSEERMAALRRLREADHTEATRLLHACWANEQAADKLKLLQVIAATPAPDDEPFLEWCLNDRSKQVRSAAADILASMTDSALSQRMAERVTAMITASSSGMLRRKSQIEATVPEDTDDAMKRDGLEAKACDGLGPKAVLLRGIVAAAPLSCWSRFNMDPDQLIDAALKSDWAASLIHGWIDAAAAQRDAAWATALLTGVCFQAADKKSAFDAAARDAAAGRLLDILDPAQQEAIAFDSLGSLGQRPALLTHLITRCDFPWSTPLSKAVLKAVAERLSQTNAQYDYTFRSHVSSTLAQRLSPELAYEVDQGWPRDAKHWDRGLDEAVDQLTETLKFRRQMLAAFTVI